MYASTVREISIDFCVIQQLLRTCGNLRSIAPFHSHMSAPCFNFSSLSLLSQADRFAWIVMPLMDDSWQSASVRPSVHLHVLSYMPLESCVCFASIKRGKTHGRNLLCSFIICVLLFCFFHLWFMILQGRNFKPFIGVKKNSSPARWCSSFDFMYDDRRLKFMTD
jgi:hypothetical protein